MSQRASLKEVFPSIGLDLGKKGKSAGRGGGGDGGGEVKGKPKPGGDRRHSEVPKPTYPSAANSTSQGAGGRDGGLEGKTKPSGDRRHSHVPRPAAEHRSNLVDAAANLTNQQKGLSLPVGHGRSKSPALPSIVVVKEKGHQKTRPDGRSSSLERNTLAVPETSAASRRHSEGLRPETGSLAVPDHLARPGSAGTLSSQQDRERRNSSCLRLSREDLENLRQMDTSPAASREDPQKPDVLRIQSELRTEFETEKNFRASYRQRYESTDIASLVSLTPLMSLGPPASAAGSKEYLPLGPTELREQWRVQSAGEGQGEIRAIRGMCFTATGHLAVTEEKNSRVQIFNASDGRSLRVLRETSTIRRMQPAGICHVPETPILAVADLNRVVFLDHDFKGQWSTEVLIKNKTNLTGVAAVHRGALVLTDIGIKPSVGLFEPDGRVIREFQADFERPQGVTVSHELGITFVSDSTVGCVYLFDHDGRLISRIGQMGDDSVRLVYPHGMCCLSSGTCLLVADRAQHRLVVFDVRNHAVDHLLADEKLFSPICLASGVGNKYLAISEENQDFKVNDYELKMYRMKRATRKP